MAAELTERQILELRCLGFTPKTTPLTIEELLQILPSEINGDCYHYNLTLTAPDSKYRLKWVCGYKSDNPMRKPHYYCEAGTPLEAVFSLLKRIIMESGTELLNS